MTRQVQRCENGHIAFDGTTPEASALIVDEIECISCKAQQIEDAGVMFGVALGEAVVLDRLAPGRKDGATGLRPGASSDGREMTTARDLGFDDGKHLFGSAAAFARN